MRHDALRVVCYAVNGTGVGHLTRLLAIARWLRRYAAALGERLEVWFLTSSEAEGLAFAEGFAAFKIPSKTVVAEAGIDRRTYAALAKQWVWHTLGLLRPDVLVVDTFPRGSFGELLGALDLARSTVFIHRPVKPEVAERPDFQAMARLYDLVIVPEVESPAVASLGAHDRLVFSGPVLLRERWELIARDDARRRLGVGVADRCVYISAGGGGDPGAEAQLDAAVAALSHRPGTRVVVGAGALYRGRPFPAVTTLTGRAAEWSLAFDAAVCAAGYNTFGELMFAGVPAVFVPQEKLADDQRARAERAVRAGAAAMLAVGGDVAAEVDALLERADVSHAARSLVPANGARVAAAEILRLVVPPTRVDRAEEALDDEALGPTSSVGDMEVLSMAAELVRRRDADLGVAIGACVRWLAARRDAKELRGLVETVARGLADTDVERRLEIVDGVLAALVDLEPGDGANARRALASGAWGASSPSRRTEAACLAAAMRAGQFGSPPRSS